MAGAFALSSGVLIACVHHPVRRNTTTAATAAPAVTEARIGSVYALGAEGHFVLIETPSALAASTVSEGQLLHSRPSAALSRAATADLRVSRERHESLIVANVVAGEPAVGDLVYFQPSGAAPSPSPDSISAIPASPLPGLFPPRHP